jgi:hypothetical protein
MTNDFRMAYPKPSCNSIEHMSLAELKEQASALPLDQQAELAAYLADRLRRDDPAYQKELARLIDDRDPENWVRWRDVKRKSKV